MALAQIGMARREIVVMVMRQRGDLNPCGQSPMDFESITLATRSHCLGMQRFGLALRTHAKLRCLGARRQRGDLNPCGQSPMDF